MPRVVEGVADDAGLVVDRELGETRRARRSKRSKEVARLRYRSRPRVAVERLPGHYRTPHVPPRLAGSAHDHNGGQSAHAGIGDDLSEADAGKLVDGDEDARIRPLEHVTQLIGRRWRGSTRDEHAERQAGRPQRSPRSHSMRLGSHTTIGRSADAPAAARPSATPSVRATRSPTVSVRQAPWRSTATTSPGRSDAQAPSKSVSVDDRELTCPPAPRIRLACRRTRSEQPEVVGS